MQEDIIYINTDQYDSPKPATTLIEGRENFVKMQYVDGMPEVTIWIQAYNQLEKTKRCVESVLKHTKEINYELILVDNGSTEPEILEYFKSVEYEPKKIMRFTKNLESGYPLSKICIGDIAPFFVPIACDLVVTPNWLHNLLRCIKSDRKIGMVNPTSSNVSNQQSVDLRFSSYEEMEILAEQFNKSDPKKWEERTRLITLGTVYRKEALYAVGMPLLDIGFFHDFSDDDISYRIRHMGYKIILAKDTWIHHDHDYNLAYMKDYESNLMIGRNNFKEKHYGADAWVLSEIPWIDCINNLPICCESKAKILGVGVRSGEALLMLKNYLRKNSIYNVMLEAYTEEIEYRVDLCSVCDGQVVTDASNNLYRHFKGKLYDYILLERPVNEYADPIVLLDDMMSLLKEQGILMLRLTNTYNYIELLNLLGERHIYHEDILYHISYEQLSSLLAKQGKVVFTGFVETQLDNGSRGMLETIASQLPISEGIQYNSKRLFTNEFIIFVEKITV